MITILLIFILLILLWKFTAIVLALAAIVFTIFLAVVLVDTLLQKKPSAKEVISTGYTIQDSKEILKLMEMYIKYTVLDSGKSKCVRKWNEEKYLLFVLVRLAHEQGYKVRVSKVEKSDND